MVMQNSMTILIYEGKNGENRYYVSIADISIGIKTDFDVLIGQEGEQFL